MSVTLTSTNARVRDPDKVRELLDSYEVRGVEIQLTEESGVWTLGMAYIDTDWDLWEPPQALHRDRWPEEEQSAFEEENDVEETEWDKRFEVHGPEGFNALLRELAAHLETPLLILVLIQDMDAPYSPEAQALYIDPGAKEVVTLDVSL